jgi:hypothetical protein
MACHDSINQFSFRHRSWPAWKLIDCVTPSGGGGGGDAKVNSNYVIAKLFSSGHWGKNGFLSDEMPARRAFCII